MRLKNIVLNCRAIVRSLAVMVIIVGCQDENIIGDSRGNIVGYVKLYDENGVKMQEASDVKVSLDKDHSVVTDSDGRYEFKGVDAGTYHLLYEREGFGAMKKFNYIFTAGNVPGVVPNTGLIQLATLKLVNKSIEASGGTVSITGTLQQTDSYYLMYSFFDKADGKPGQEITSYGSSWCCSPTTSFAQTLYMPSSSTLYLGVYAVSLGNQNGQYSYYDYEAGVYVNAGIKELIAPVKLK